MDENNTTHAMLESSLPGAWIIEHNRIWQMHLLKARELAQFCYDRGLSNFRGGGIVHLWQLGLLKADLIECEEEVAYDGLVVRGNDRYGRYLYSDERQLQQRADGWADAEKTITPLNDNIKLYFHPFRYYVLYHINRILPGVNISKMQMFSQSNYPTLLEWTLSPFNRWTTSDQFIPTIKQWNDIASLCILTEPCVYQQIFHSIQYNPSDVQDHRNGAEEIRKHIVDYWQTNIKSLYLQIGIDRLEQIRCDLCFDTQMLDDNRWIHTLLCLGEAKLRLELEGHLGGALLLRTMAEMLRRAAEEAFNTTLREEDELGKGMVPESFKETLYGSKRLLDNHQAASYFVRRYGLNYKPLVHLYGEGATECGALNYFLKIMGLFVPVIDLHGLILSPEKNQMLTFFRDSLQADIKDQMYSVVVVDDDLDENVKVIKNHARINQTSENEGMFGRFFLSRQDFETANFEIEELEEILWKWVSKDTGVSQSQEDRTLLHNCVKNAQGGTAFFNGVGQASRSLPQLTGYTKGEEWGAKLMDYAWEYPLRQNRRRQIMEIVELVTHLEKVASMESYESSKKRLMVDSETGELIARPPKT